jgi:hypothetical protein
MFGLTRVAEYPQVGSNEVYGGANQHAIDRRTSGVLLLTPRAGAGGTYIEALREGRREPGYVERQNL